jgi:Family of unknown function (DUF6298)
MRSTLRSIGTAVRPHAALAIDRLRCRLLHQFSFSLIVFCALASQASAGGPLRVHPDNPRYFTDDSGRAIHLAGHQWFNDLQYSAWDRAVDVKWDQYLDFMNERGMNYLRNWIIWSTGKPGDDVPTPLMPFARTGPGTALDGGPKFDLTQFDSRFFERLASQTAAAEQRGVYVSVMLFEVYGFMAMDGEYPENNWGGNPFHGPNNINGIDVDGDGDGEGMEFFFTEDPKVLDIQRRYVGKVLEAIAPRDNVFLEVSNELQAPDFQRSVMRQIREAETGTNRRHLVYLSPGGRNRAGKWSPLPKPFFFEGAADVTAVTRSWNRSYFGDPPVEEAGRPLFMDMDHVAATVNDGDNDWNNDPATPWKLFTRGYHVCVYDSDYWKPGHHRDAWDRTRRSCGATVALANQIDLARLSPRSDLASSKYCLADPDREYVILVTDGNEVEVKKLSPRRTYELEWLPLTGGDPVSRETVTPDGAISSFTPPEENLVLHIRRRE